MCLTCGILDWHRVKESLDAGQGGGTRHARGGDVQTARPVPQQPTPMYKPAEAAVHDPAARKHDKTFLSRVALDHAVAHAVPVRPLVTGCSGEGPVQNCLPQAGPRRLAWVKSLKCVAILHRGGDDRDGQPGAIGINQGHALAPDICSIPYFPDAAAFS